MLNFFQKQLTYPTNEILEMLNTANKEYMLPDLENPYFYLLASRLHVFQSDDKWAMVFEIVTYATKSHGARAVTNIIQPYGNIVKDMGRSNAIFFHPVSDVDEKNPLVREEEDLLVRNPTAKSIRIHNTLIPLRAYDPGKTTVDVLREVSAEKGNLFFEDISTLQDSCFVEKIPLVRTFDEWYHPDVGKGEKVESSPFFVGLTEAILSNTVKDFVYTGETNTHWSNWPESGTY